MSTIDEIRALLKNMRAGKPAGSGEEKDTQTTTVTQVLSDGSVLVTVYEGNRIVSETKTRSANPEQTPAVLSTRTETSGMAQMAQAASTLGESALLNLLQRP